ncbi:hypothetical protein AK830_g9352 [Neonectria ditissima]|uniref:Uncharacterized protein n=1 Tax=Neonectria ditissima TaxID=78410 RepID=A0A0P7B977_9HYPO|nr:hypothetical protein AK830_g9352 [Neonectria ditissima]
MPPKAGGTVWDNSEFLMELGVSFFLAAQENGGISPEVRKSIVDHLQNRGFSITWEAIRTMAGRQTMKWDANVHEDILICLFQHLKLSTTDWTSVMNDLKVMGYTFTESALRQHVQKLRRNRDADGVQATVGGSSPATSTPRAKATPRKRATPAKKSKAMANLEEEDEQNEKLNLKLEMDSDQEEPFTPKRPAKRAKVTPKPKVEPEEHMEMEI